MTSGKKRGLGRGLSALFGDSSPKEKAQNINQNNKHFNAINILRLDLMQSVPFQMKDTTGRDLNVSFIGGKDDQILKFITLNSSDTSNSYSKLIQFLSWLPCLLLCSVVYQ